MIFERKIEIEIKKILEVKEAKPILLIGARQIGKTTLVKKIGKNYGDYIYINLEKNKSINDLFNNDLNISMLIEEIEILVRQSINSKTLIILDEIQSNPRAITALKYFSEETKYKIIATGSNLGISLFSSKSSFPVGKVSFLNMYQLDFEEFLKAVNESFLLNKMLEGLKKDSISEMLHNQLLKLFDLYIQLGGMPEVIHVYLTQGINEALKVSSDILSGYKIDLVKYSNPKLASRLSIIYEHIDVMLQSDNQKFKFTKIDKVGYKNLENPLSWLFNSKMVIPVYKIENINLPLRSNIKDNNFKLLYNDVGLLLRQANYQLENLIKSQDKIYTGVVLENYIGTVLIKYYPTLFYYQKNTTEIDYIITEGENVIPIEVKSGNNTKAKSLSAYKQRYNPSMTIKVSRNNYQVVENNYFIPVYLLDSFISEL